MTIRSISLSVILAVGPVVKLPGPWSRRRDRVVGGGGSPAPARARDDSTSSAFSGSVVESVSLPEARPVRPIGGIRLRGRGRASAPLPQPAVTEQAGSEGSGSSPFAKSGGLTDLEAERSVETLRDDTTRRGTRRQPSGGVTKLAAHEPRRPWLKIGRWCAAVRIPG
jgi:hypothetical protein